MSTFKKIITAVSTVAVAGLGILLKKIISGEIAPKYSMPWIKNLSDEEFYDEREIVRQAYCNGNERAWTILDLFNDEEIRRMNARYEEEHPNAEPRHREHGWYLPNDD